MVGVERPEADSHDQSSSSTAVAATVSSVPARSRDNIDDEDEEDAAVEPAEELEWWDPPALCNGASAGAAAVTMAGEGSNNGCGGLTGRSSNRAGIGTDELDISAADRGAVEAAASSSVPGSPSPPLWL